MYGFAFSLVGSASAIAPTSLASEPGAVTHAQAAPATDDPKLPEVLIIGDSISVGYTDDVRALLAGIANVHRAPGNSGPSSSGLLHASEWLQEGAGHWDVIHFNFGLHDIKLAPSGKDAPYPSGHQVPPDQYRQNLLQIVSIFKTSGALLIFATTTPVPDGKLDPPRTSGDEVIYNDIAREVMANNGVAIDDLYGVALPQLSVMQIEENVHYTPEGYGVLAKQVASSLDSALKTLAGKEDT